MVDFRRWNIDGLGAFYSVRISCIRSGDRRSRVWRSKGFRYCGGYSAHGYVQLRNRHMRHRKLNGDLHRAAHSRRLQRKLDLYRLVGNARYGDCRRSSFGWQSLHSESGKNAVRRVLKNRCCPCALLYARCRGSAICCCGKSGRGVLRSAGHA